MGASCPFFGGEEINKLDLGFVKIYLESGHVYTISRAVYTVNMGQGWFNKVGTKINLGFGSAGDGQAVYGGDVVFEGS